MKGRKLAGLFREDFKQMLLGHHQYVGIFCFETTQIKRSDGAIRGLDGGRKDFACAKCMDSLGQAELVEDFEGRGMDRVTAKFAVEILVHLEQGDADAAACQQQGKHRTGRPAACNAASGFRAGDCRAGS